MDNIDLVSEFFANQAAAEAPVEDTPKAVDMTQFNQAEERIKNILAERGYEDTYVNTIVSQIRDAYSALSVDDEGNVDQLDIPALQAEISDIISCFSPDGLEDDEEALAVLTCEIVDAITNKYILDDNGTVAADSEDKLVEPESNENLLSFDDTDEENDELDPSFWD